MAGEKLSLEQFSAVLNNIDAGLGPAADQLWKEGINTEALLKQLTKQDMHMVGIKLAYIVPIYEHFHPTDADTDANKGGDNTEVVAALVREVERLNLERHAAASTTTTDRVLGQTWIEKAKHTSDILAGIGQLSYEDYTRAAQQAKASLIDFQQRQPPRKKHKANSATTMSSGNFGSRLVDLIQVDDDESLQEAKHMQPQLMQLLHGVCALRPAAVQIHDTHSKDPIQHPAGQVDCSLLASDLRRWSSMVVPVEFKLWDSELPTAVGQLVNRIRHTLQQQPDRKRAFGVIITMQSIEVFLFTRLFGSAFSLQRSGAKALTFAADCAGFQWLVRLIHGTLADLGYRSPQLPDVFSLGGHIVTNVCLIGQGLKEGGSCVYHVDCAGGQAVLKLNKNERESEVLTKLGTVSNIVQLLGHGAVNSFKGQAWHAILIRPFGRLLATADTARLYKQATFDIATAIGGSFARGIRHQDVSPFNMVVYQDRVFLTDWSAGRVSSGSASPVEDLGKVTMTPLFGAISVLKGSRHTISSHLESLFYSLYYVAVGSNMPDAKVFETFAQCHLWWVSRQGTMVSELPCHVDRIHDSEVKSFMLRLHQVFFTWDEEQECCKYRKDVTVEDVQEVCRHGDVDSSDCILDAM